MRATERYERAWNAFQIHLNHNPKASLIPFLKERHVSHRSMHRWMSEKGYSVRLAKQQIRLLQAEARKECSEAIAKDTGMMFLPMEMPSEPVCPENYLFGIPCPFPYAIQSPTPQQARRDPPLALPCPLQVALSQATYQYLGSA